MAFGADKPDRDNGFALRALDVDDGGDDKLAVGFGLGDIQAEPRLAVPLQRAELMPVLSCRLACPASSIPIRSRSDSNADSSIDRSARLGKEAIRTWLSRARYRASSSRSTGGPGWPGSRRSSRSCRACPSSACRRSSRRSCQAGRCEKSAAPAAGPALPPTRMPGLTGGLADAEAVLGSWEPSGSARWPAPSPRHVRNRIRRPVLTRAYVSQEGGRRAWRGTVGIPAVSAPPSTAETSSAAACSQA